VVRGEIRDVVNGARQKNQTFIVNIHVKPLLNVKFDRARELVIAS